MATITNPETFFDAFSDAVYRKDVEAYLDLYDDNVVVFDMWQEWTYDGLPAWRAMVSGWFSGLGTDRDVVTFRDTKIENAGELGYVTAVARFAAVSETGEELRFLDNRLTWVIRRSGASGASWKIIHQHTSGPIDFNTMKVVLKKED
jgi:ketosteroid isomerase-like protein